MKLPKGGIAFFDSGIGGLTVLQTCIIYNEIYNDNKIFYYYGDNHHAPYGNLPKEKICKYTRKVFRKFKQLKVCAAVIACNTVTAVCVEELRDRHFFPIIGTEPAVSTACGIKGDVYVLTTRATYESERFQSLCEIVQARYPQTKLCLFPCDGLAGAIEKGIGDADCDYSSFLPKGKPAAVVLGCTHYVFLREYIKKFYNCPIFDGNEGVAKRLKSILDKKNSPKQPFYRNLRDERPLFKKNVFRQPFSTTFFSKKNDIKQTNKCLRFLRRKNRRTPLEIKGSRVFFLGKNARFNAQIYKQMFGSGCMVSKVVEKIKKN